MRLITLAVLLLSICYMSCKCKDDCVSDASFTWKIVDKATGKNLYKDSSLYSKDSLKVTAIVPGGQDINARAGVDTNGMIYVNTVDHAMFYIAYYSASKADTFLFTNLKVSTGKCCSGIIMNFDVSRNGETVCSNCARQTHVVYH